MNVYLRPTILIICCLLFKDYRVQAQATSQIQYFVPQPFARSPAATAIEKYGTYQVNEFTGVPDISIPLYTIDAGEFKVPITLSYHASGNKVTDVASWAGLGWSVSSGGQISRRTMGLPDDCTYGYLNGYMHMPNNNTYNSQLGMDSIEYIANNTYDSKPDIYSYDFPGHGGKFFFDGSAGNNYTPRLLPFAPLKISHTMVTYSSSSPPPATGITNFSIIDEHGDYYKFGDAAIDVTASSSGGGYALQIASAWKLETMISQNRRDTVSFSYQPDQVNYPAADSEIFTVVDNVDNIDGTATYSPSYSQSPTTPGNLNNVTEQLPKQINFKNGKVVFDLDPAKRTDLPANGSGAYGLADIKIYKYNYSLKAMELQKTVVFYKTYFSANSTTRLRLDSIQVLDKAGSIIQHYRFDYNTSITLPDYSSYAQDYWGYYNGQLSGNPGKTANTMLTPLQTINYQPTSQSTPENVNIGQANRNCDSNYMQAYVLTGIHYPTGGYTTFTYQTNQYNVTGVLNLAGGLRVKTISSYDGVNPTPIVKTYVYSNNTARANFFLNYAYFQASQTHRYYKTLLEGAYPNLSATELVRTFTSNPHCDLEAYDGATVVYPAVSEYIGTPVNNIGRIDYTFTDQKDALLDASAAGTLVYLSSFYVRGHLLSKKEFINKGSGIYQVVSGTTNSYTAFPQTDYSNVGVAIKKLYYNEGAAGNPILKGDGNPDDTNSFLCFNYDIISDDNYLTGTTTHIYSTTDTTQYTTSTITYKYDNITHQQITRTYRTDSKGNTLVNSKRYPADYLSGTTTGSSLLDSMLNRNMQAIVIESIDSLRNATTSFNGVTAAQFNIYKNGYIPYTIVPSTISTLSIGTPVNNFTQSYYSSNTLTADSRYEQVISFDQYDQQNNIMQYTPRNATPTAILWDQLYQNPVAQVRNATASVSSTTTIAYTGFEGDNKNGWYYSGAPVLDPTAPGGYYSYPLSAGSITSNYVSIPSADILSLWSNNGAPTVYAGSYLTGSALSTVNGWTYYEYPVPASSGTITISGSMSIDELRLFPATSLMTNYIYDPNGLIAMADPKGTINHFEYDFAQRLKNVKNIYGNIVSNTAYHMYDMTVANAAQSNTFTRNNCPAGTSPTSTTYSVPAAKYYSSTLASANAEAIYDMNTNGQAKANAVCGCPVPTYSVTLTNSTGHAYSIQFNNGSTNPSFNFLNSGTTTVQVPVGSYTSAYIAPSGSYSQTFTMGSRTPITGHSATFTSVIIGSGSADNTVSIH